MKTKDYHEISLCRCCHVSKLGIRDNPVCGRGHKETETASHIPCQCALLFETQRIIEFITITEFLKILGQEAYTLNREIKNTTHVMHTCYAKHINFSIFNSHRMPQEYVHTRRALQTTSEKI
jgi:hypothetical protein